MTGTDRQASTIRKIVVYREELLADGGCPADSCTVRATAAAVIHNPWLPDAPEDLGDRARHIAPVLAKELTDRLARALGGVDAVTAFGKAAVVGTSGEWEHGAALIHTPYFGNLVRELLHGESIICFADARGEAGSIIEVPVWHKTAAATRDYYQTVTARIPDAPRPDEIVVVAAASNGTRPRPRIGDRTTDPAVSLESIEYNEEQNA